MEILRETIRSLLSNKLRTFLSMLGIIIGIASVITVMSLGEGTTANIKETVSSLGSNVLSIYPGFSGGRGGFIAQRITSSTKYEDAQYIKDSAPHIINATPIVKGYNTLKFNDYSYSAEGVGTTPEIKDIVNMTVESGSFFTQEDIDNMSNYIVLGSTVAENLFEQTNPLGQKVYVITSTGKVAFTVIGVLKEQGSSIMLDIDNAYFMPYTTADARIFHENGNASMILAKASSEEETELAQIELDFLLYGLLGNENSYRISSQNTMLEAISQITGVMTFILVAIAAISLVVGGIGIMNIMLVSVSERTREIGIKMALGASRSRILLEFLFESIILTFIAGIIGVSLGTGLSNLIAGFAAQYDLKSITTVGSVLVSFGVSSGVGLFFGIYPARKASKLSPIEALRYE